MSRTTPATRLSTRDALRWDWYLVRFPSSMQDYSRKEYRRIKRELRAETRAAAAEVGMRRALRDLGHPRVLAEQYIAEYGKRLPRYTTGAVAAGLAVSLIVYPFVAYSLGALDAIESMGGGSVMRYLFGSETVFTSTAEEISVAAVGSPGWLVVYGVAATVAFVLGARLWRVFG